MTVALTDSAGAPTTSVSATSGVLTTATATLRDAAGAGLADAIVTFSTDINFAIITGPTTALTNASGAATATLTGTITAGASTVTATSAVGTPPVVVTASKSFSLIP
jgi:hypothetical protein